MSPKEKPPALASKPTYEPALQTVFFEFWKGNLKQAGSFKVLNMTAEAALDHFIRIGPDWCGGSKDIADQRRSKVAVRRPRHQTDERIAVAYYHHPSLCLDEPVTRYALRII